MPRRSIAALAIAWLLAFPPLSAWAAGQSGKATSKKKVEKLRFVGPSVPCKRWGPLQVAVTVAKTTTTIGTKKKVAIKILKIDFPIVSDATFKTKYINDQALPLLVEDTLANQSAIVEVISGATDTTISYKQSLQAALIQAKK